ncbi:unnamed protein product [Alopecurus aequalis]
MTAPALVNRRRHGCGSCCCRPRPRRHLYVVLDEINTGHSIYKLNVDDLDGGDEDAINCDGMYADEEVQTEALRLPDAVLRLGVSSVGDEPRFDAIDSKIVITGISSTVVKDEATGITLVYDTKTAKLDIGRPPPDRLMPTYRAASTADKLCVLDYFGESPPPLVEKEPLDGTRFSL